ncbi:MAG: 2-hydroxyacid dehydrogenase [Candidatus Hodarchaeota archaeon]
MKVLVVWPRLAELIAEQKDLVPDHVEILIPDEGTDDELLRLIPDVEVIVCTRLSAEVARKGTKLKLIQKTGAGVDAIPFNVIRNDVYLANTSGSNPVPLAEGAIALLLALAKRIVHRHNLFPERSNQRGTELRGKNVGILGLGAIGTEVAMRLQAFEMNILGIKRRPSEELKKQLNLQFLGGSEDLHYVLRESDFIILTLPLTPATRGLIGAVELEQMKPSAFLVNVGRAALIKEEPLYNALKDERIAGAAIDVWWIPHWWDPKWKPELDRPSRFPFWELPNVITTPHDIVATERTPYSMRPIRIMAENIGRIAKGQPPINQVDKKHQY